MRLPKEFESDERSMGEIDVNLEDDTDSLAHKRAVRKKIEEQLERKRLKKEMDDYDDEFDWEAYDP